MRSHRAWGYRLWGFCVVALASAMAGASIWAAVTKRAKPPHWSSSVSGAFFPDAREKLEGQRPAAGSGGAARPVAGGGMPAAEATSDAAAGGVYPWSKLIGSEELEDEIKTVQKKFSETITLPAPFKGGGYKEARRLLTELAVLFGIIAEYDGDVRWKKEAPSMRELLARTGFNCKVGTDASYNESKLRKDELETLVRGGGGPSVPNVDAKAVWDKVAGRPPLMQRLEAAQQQGVAPSISSAADFNKSLDKVLKESELIAAIAEVITREGYEFADDSGYQKFAKEMRAAAIEVAEAAKSKNYDGARAASGKIDKACSQCHEGFRS